MIPNDPAVDYGFSTSGGRYKITISNIFNGFLRNSRDVRLIRHVSFLHESDVVSWMILRIGSAKDTTGWIQAPEVLTYGGMAEDGRYRGYGRAVDIWSIGCVVLQMVTDTTGSIGWVEFWRWCFQSTGRAPWPDMHPFQITMRVSLELWSFYAILCTKHIFWLLVLTCPSPVFLLIFRWWQLAAIKPTWWVVVKIQ